VISVSRVLTVLGFAKGMLRDSRLRILDVFHTSHIHGLEGIDLAQSSSWRLEISGLVLAIHQILC